MNFKNTDIIVLSIGELNTNKNHEIIIRALSLIDNKNLVYAICGREVSEIGKKQKLEKLANSLNVRVEFLGYRNDIAEICNCAKIGAIPSYKEGLGLAGIEMLASGIPVVGADRQGIKDYVINNVTGYLCDPKDATSFANGIVETLRLSNEKGVKERCIMEAQKYDKKLVYEEMKKIYNKVL